MTTTADRGRAPSGSAPRIDRFPRRQLLDDGRFGASCGGTPASAIAASADAGSVSPTSRPAHPLAGASLEAIHLARATRAWRLLAMTPAAAPQITTAARPCAVPRAHEPLLPW
jgi:hypothetical protein